MSNARQLTLSGAFQRRGRVRTRFLPARVPSGTDLMRITTELPMPQFLDLRVKCQRLPLWANLRAVTLRGC